MLASAMALSACVFVMGETIVYGCASGALGYRMASVDLDAVNATAKTNVTALFDLPSNVESVQCGTAAGNKYYAIFEDGDTYEKSFATFNFTTGNVVSIGSYDELGTNYYDMTYDEAAGKLYVLKNYMEFDENEKAVYYTDLSEVNTADGSLTPKKTLLGTWVGLVADGKGGFYLVKRTQKSWYYYAQLYSLSSFEQEEPEAVVENTTVSYNFTYQNSAVMKDDKIYYVCGANLFLFDLEQKTVSKVGTIGSSFTGFAFTLSSEDGVVGESGAKESTVKLVRRTYFGDSMGNVANDKDMKRNEYFYNTDGSLTRIVEMGRGYGDNDAYGMTYFTANSFDEQGNILKATRYQYGLYDFGDETMRLSSEENYAYNEAGQLVLKSSDYEAYGYEYDEAGNCVRETYYRPSTQDTIYVLDYSKFNAAGKPEEVVSSSPNHPEWTGYDYMEYRKYDSNGNLVSAERVRLVEGTPVPQQREEWNYEGTFLTEYVKYIPDADYNMQPYFKTSYAMQDGDPMKVMHSDYTYWDEKWSLQSGSTCLDEYQDFSLKAREFATDLVVSQLPDTFNTVRIAFEVPNIAYSNACKAKVFRNGKLIAEKDVLDMIDNGDGFGMPLLAYVDSTVVNGTYDYFVQISVGTGNEYAEEIEYTGYYVTDGVAVTLALELPAVENVKLSSGRKDSNNSYFGTISWTNPANISDYGFISNELYFENMQAGEAVTDSLGVTELEGNFYRATSNVFILTRYDFGKAMSDTVTVALSELKEIITGIENTTVAGNTFTFNGRQLVLGANADVTVYTAGGRQAIKASNTDNVDLSRLQKGAYIVTVENDGKVTAYKISVR